MIDVTTCPILRAKSPQFRVVKTPRSRIISGNAHGACGVPASHPPCVSSCGMRLSFERPGEPDTCVLLLANRGHTAQGGQELGKSKTLEYFK